MWCLRRSLAVLVACLLSCGGEGASSPAPEVSSAAIGVSLDAPAPEPPAPAPDWVVARLARDPHASITVRTEPAGAEIFDTGGVRLGTAPLEIPLGSLPTRLVLRAPDCDERTVRLGSATQDEITIRLRPDPDAPQMPVVSPLSGPWHSWGCDGRPGSSRQSPARDEDVPLPPRFDGSCTVEPLIGMGRRELVSLLGAPDEREGREWTYSHQAGGIFGTETS